MEQLGVEWEERLDEHERTEFLRPSRSALLYPPAEEDVYVGRRADWPCADSDWRGALAHKPATGDSPQCSVSELHADVTSQTPPRLL